MITNTSITIVGYSKCRATSTFLEAKENCHGTVVPGVHIKQFNRYELRTFVSDLRRRKVKKFSRAAFFTVFPPHTTPLHSTASKGLASFPIFQSIPERTVASVAFLPSSRVLSGKYPNSIPNWLFFLLFSSVEVVNCWIRHGRFVCPAFSLLGRCLFWTWSVPLFWTWSVPLFWTWSVPILNLIGAYSELDRCLFWTWSVPGRFCPLLVSSRVVVNIVSCPQLYDLIFEWRYHNCGIGEGWCFYGLPVDVQFGEWIGFIQLWSAFSSDLSTCGGILARNRKSFRDFFSSCSLPSAVTSQYEFAFNEVPMFHQNLLEIRVSRVVGRDER